MKNLTLIILSALMLIMFTVQILAILAKEWPIWWALFVGELMGLFSWSLLAREPWGKKIIGSIMTPAVYCLMARIVYGRVDIVDANFAIMGLVSYLLVYYWLQLLPGRRTQPVRT